MPLKKKKYNARFPAGRIKKIMQTDEEVGKVAQAVPVIISRTLEMFVESLLTKSLQVTLSRNAKTLSPSHLKQCILAESRFDFLRDLVKNIPDITPAEEKESTQNWSAENSPNTCRYNEMKKSKLPTQMSVPGVNHMHQTHSSDSSSDCESTAKNRYLVRGNGRFPEYRTQEEERCGKVQTQTSNCNPVPSNQHCHDLSQPHMSHTSALTHHRLLNKPTNFYQETLRDVEDKEVPPPTHSSVIQPNPEYTGTSTIKLTPQKEIRPSDQQPQLHIDISKGFPKELNNILSGNSSTKPVFHLDLSSMPLTPSSTDTGSPFTPTLLRQPQTPLKTESSPLKFNPDPVYKNTLHRSESFNQFRKGPPPLQTLKRTSSLDNSRTPTDLSKPQIKIDVTHDGQSPKFHLDLSNYKVDGVSSPSSFNPKKRKTTSSEPPGLLPITPTQKMPVNASKNSSSSMQLDEDYDA